MCILPSNLARSVGTHSEIKAVVETMRFILKDPIVKARFDTSWLVDIVQCLDILDVNEVVWKPLIIDGPMSSTGIGSSMPSTLNDDQKEGE